MNTPASLAASIEQLYATESRRVLATLIRLVGDFDLAEEALHEAFAAALEQWASTGIPAQPRAWLVSTGRFKAIDRIRRRERLKRSLPELQHRQQLLEQADLSDDEQTVRDDQLRLIFTCCHPALPVATQIALTLREVCGLTTEEVASAFLLTPPTIAQRIVRGKAKIRDAKIPYQIPQPSDLPDRLEAVLSVIYLVFNEGYSASSGASLIRHDLSAEAIRLGRLIVELLPDAEARGLLALMLLHDSRRLARSTAEGDLILLEDQDRSLWRQEQIAEGIAILQQTFSAGLIGPFGLQAAIAAVHARAASTAQTDWPEIIRWYDLLLKLQPSPVIELNRAVAVAMHEGPAAGLNLIDSIFTRGELLDYHFAHAARAELCRRLGQVSAARASYEQALQLTQQAPEQRFLRHRLAQLKAHG